MTGPGVLETDVLITGGGPCGLMLANELGRRGVRCLVVDRKPGTAFNPQANATQARTMEHYRRLGFAHRVRAQGLPADHPTDVAYLTRFAGHEIARLRLPTAAQATQVIRGLGGSWSAAELPHRVSQKFVEVVLRNEAQALPGVDLRYGWEMRSFSDKGEGITAEVAPVDTSSEQGVTVQARWLVGADGARSSVRAQLGISWDGGTGFKRSFMGGRMLAVYLKAPDFYRLNPNDRAWMYVQVHPAQRSFIMSVDGVSEFAFHTQLADDTDVDALTHDDARALFARASGLDIPIEIMSMAPWLAGHALVASRFQQGHVFIGGDAAHLFTPTGGLGYNTAVEDAVNLGWKLAAVLKGQAPPALLDSYGLERKPLAQRNTGYARQFADSIGLFDAAPDLDDDSPAGQQARKVAGEYLNGHVRREFNVPGVTFGGRYDGSPSIVSDGSTPPPDAANSYQATACPGGRPPHAWLPDGRSLFDLFGFEWTLLVLKDPTRQDTPTTAGFEAAAQALGVELKVVCPEDEAPPDPQSQKGPNTQEGEQRPKDPKRMIDLYESPLILIRPDHIVAWRGTSDADAPQVMQQVLGWGG
jgi:2-polyprenyl-6-methoxyphenol hydroxylase-like FAD-dependent oxidoreductase